MDPILAAAGVFALGLATGMPVAFVLLCAAFIGLLAIRGFDVALGALMAMPYSKATDIGLVTIPLFILMGSFATAAGVSEKAYQMAYRFVGHLRGGLAIKGLFGCTWDDVSSMDAARPSFRPDRDPTRARWHHSRMSSSSPHADAPTGPRATAARGGPEPAERLCFAYGSNLCADALAAWLADRGLDASHLRAVGPAWLPDHALSFGYLSQSRGAGALDVRPLRGSVVQGALLAPTPEVRDALDAKEGVAGGAYERRDTEVVLPDGTVRSATVYVVTEGRRSGHHAPTDDYLREVEAGYAAWGHDPAPLRSVARGGPGALTVDAAFVYGTLLRGESNEHVLHGAPVRRVLDARVRGALHETGDPWPVMVLDGVSTVHGELVELDDIEARLGPLDELESFEGYGRPGRLYHRTLVDVATAQGARLAWTYVAGETIRRGPRIESGSWRVHRRGGA